MTHLTSSTSLPDMLGIAPMRRATLRSAGAPAVLLSQVRDPANAGSILAAAVAHGIGTVIAASGSVDPFEQKCVRAARGAHFSLQVVSGADEKEVIEHYRAAGARVIAIGTDGAAPWRTDLRGPVLFVVHGEEPLERIGALCDELVAIPRGEVELGVAVRAANVLYERARQEDER
jgi:TrmH family RNA methyltransferase